MIIVALWHLLRANFCPLIMLQSFVCLRISKTQSTSALYINPRVPNINRFSSFFKVNIKSFWTQEFNSWHRQRGLHGELQSFINPVNVVGEQKAFKHTSSSLARKLCIVKSHSASLQLHHHCICTAVNL